MTPEELTIRLKDEARRLGFDLAGACAAAKPEGLEHFDRWLAAGRAGTMDYLAQRRAAYQHPSGVLEGARSLLMLAVGYRTAEPAPPGAGQGRIARYAWGFDYHDVIHQRLHRLADFHRELTPGAAVRGVVDTAPLLERYFAQQAGLGWIGRNTTLINRQLGSWILLAALLTSEPLAYDAPSSESHCGSCRACLDACPSGALVEPYCLDARRCVSYLTIEHREPIDPALRESIGDRLFGCDACQEACPWNQKTPSADEPAFCPGEGANPVELAELFSLDDEAFRRRFRNTPLWRARRAGLLRNAAIALGNGSVTPAAKEALERGVGDADPMVREACAWALAQHER